LSLITQYVKQTGCVAHFNIRSEGIIRSQQFLSGVCSQITTKFGLSKDLAQIGENNGGTRLRRLLEEVSAHLKEEEHLVIAVDGLDEVDEHDQTNGANILHLPSVLPRGVFFIMTRRRVVDMPFYVHCPVKILDLKDYKTGCKKDIQTFIRRACNHQNIRTWVKSQNLSSDEFIHVLSEKSECNFMYLHYVLPEINRGVYSDLSITKLPIGLAGYYVDHWNRMGMRAKPLPRTKIITLYLLCEIRQPASLNLLLDFVREANAELTELDVLEVLDEWRQFLHIQQTDDGSRYSIYHTSFRDFLHGKDIVKNADVSILGINKMIAENLWQDVFRNSRLDNEEDWRYSK